MVSTVGSPAVSPRTLTAVILMCVAMLIVPLVDVAAKILGDQGISPFQIVSLRMLIGTILLTPLIMRYEPGIVRQAARHPLSVFVIGSSICAASICFFVALKYMPIPDAVAITFVQPFFVTILSRLFLREHVTAARWIALAIGFSATLMIIRPGTGSFEPASIFPLLAGFFSAIYAIALRRGVPGVSGLATTYYTHIVSLALILPLAALTWMPISAEQCLLVLGMAVIGIGVQYMLVKAYEFGEASLIAPLSYTEMIGSVFVSWLFFRQVPDYLTLIGVSILIGCAIFASYQAKAK
ncbi:DMT family transporter [Mycoplana dimorpha]|uniref:Threonine/homoserine efflux transporter RhtA n=1 Tax=Mycoplana dimorpha TaxID=28320 RepID=A0A2T5AR02_MYCDI|nr:DMT family transporter [Mycoplana dimorpha]PTM89150.1 threonine/homoserine efflux transporter RhtA [Mycoplana dimorpha]